MAIGKKEAAVGTASKSGDVLRLAEFKEAAYKVYYYTKYDLQVQAYALNVFRPSYCPS